MFYFIFIILVCYRSLSQWSCSTTSAKTLFESPLLFPRVKFKVSGSSFVNKADPMIDVETKYLNEA